jgi:hypothetical protein
MVRDVFGVLGQAPRPEEAAPTPAEAQEQRSNVTLTAQYLQSLRSAQPSLFIFQC